LAETWLGLSANPQSTPTQETARAWVTAHASDTAQIEKLDSVLKRNVPAQKTTGLLQRSTTAASISTTAALEHLKNNRALFGPLVVGRLSRHLRELTAHAESKVPSGPLETVS